MPNVKCLKCNNETFYKNIEGKDIIGKCKNCNSQITIPYKSTQRMEEMEKKCKKCGNTFNSPYIPSRSYISWTVHNSLGTTFKAERTSGYEESICEECKNKKENDKNDNSD